MSTAGAAAAGSAGPAEGAPPVSSGAAAVLLVAAVVVAALVSVSVARLIPFDEDDVAFEAVRAVPAEPAGVAALAGVAPAVTFDGAGPGLPAGSLGAWSVVAGEWAVAGGTAHATAVGEEGALAVAPTPEGADTAQVTLTDPEPGAGLVVSYRGPDSYVALQVGRTGSTVHLVEVDGRRLQPQVWVTADLASPDGPLVLAVRRRPGGYEAIANGERIGFRRVEEDAPVPWQVGLVTGVLPTATATTYDDLVVA